MAPLPSEQGPLAERVAGPLMTGLSAFNTISRMLLSVDADFVGSGTRTFDDFREVIVAMRENFDESEGIVSAELRVLDGETETLTMEKSRLESEKGKREGELADFKIELEGCKSTLANCNEALETEKRNLRSAEESLNDMREKRDRAELIRNVGLGLMVIPIAGWVAGPIVAVIGQVELNHALSQVTDARKEVEKCESQIKTYADKVEKYETLVKKAQADITEATKGKFKTLVKLRALSDKRVMVADLQIKTRRAVHQVGLLSGVGSVAELQTRRVILLKPLMEVMEEMVAVLGQITGEDLLQTEDMRRIISDLRDNHRALQADSSRGSSDEDQAYDQYT